jgi:hypothetical protein
MTSDQDERLSLWELSEVKLPPKPYNRTNTFGLSLPKEDIVTLAKTMVCGSLIVGILVGFLALPLILN